MTRSVSAAVEPRDVAVVLRRRSASKSVGKLSQYLKHMRQPWQISKTRVDLLLRARAASQYFGSSGS